MVRWFTVAFFFFSKEIFIVASSCVQDLDCENGSYCSNDSSCEICIPCDIYRRQPFLSPNGAIQCAKINENCGDCLPGYTAEILVNDKPSDYCNESPSVVSPSDPSKSLVIIAGTIGGILIASSILFFLIKHGVFKRVLTRLWPAKITTRSDSKNEESGAERQQMIGSENVQESNQDRPDRSQSSSSIVKDDGDEDDNVPGCVSETEVLEEVVVTELKKNEASSSNVVQTTVQVHRTDEASNLQRKVVGRTGNNLSTDNIRRARYNSKRFQQRSQSQHILGREVQSTSSIESSSSGSNENAESRLIGRLDSQVSASSETFLSAMEDEIEEPLKNCPSSSEHDSSHHLSSLNSPDSGFEEHPPPSRKKDKTEEFLKLHLAIWFKMTSLSNK